MNTKTVPYIIDKMDAAFIPIDTIVHCPLHKFKNKIAKNCASCEFYAGLLVININEETEWQDKYRILCEHPIARRTEKILEIVE